MKLLTYFAESLIGTFYQVEFDTETGSYELTRDGVFALADPDKAFVLTCLKAAAAAENATLSAEERESREANMIGTLVTDPEYVQILSEILAAKQPAQASDSLTVCSLGGDEDFLKVWDERTGKVVFSGSYAAVASFMNW